MTHRPAAIEDDMPAWLDGSKDMHNGKGWKEWHDAMVDGNVELKRPYRKVELATMFKISRQSIHERWLPAYKKWEERNPQ